MTMSTLLLLLAVVTTVCVGLGQYHTDPVLPILQRVKNHEDDSRTNNILSFALSQATLNNDELIEHPDRVRKLQELADDFESKRKYSRWEHMYRTHQIQQRALQAQPPQHDEAAPGEISQPVDPTKLSEQSAGALYGLNPGPVIPETAEPSEQNPLDHAGERPVEVESAEDADKAELQQQKAKPQLPPPAAANAQSPPAAAANTQSPPAAAANAQSPPVAAANTQSPPAAAANTQSPPAAAANVQSPPAAAANAQSPPAAAANTQSPPAAAANTQSPPAAAANAQSPPAAAANVQSPPAAAANTQSPPADTPPAAAANARSPPADTNAQLPPVAAGAQSQPNSGVVKSLPEQTQGLPADASTPLTQAANIPASNAANIPPPAANPAAPVVTPSEAPVSQSNPATPAPATTETVHQESPKANETEHSGGLLNAYQLAPLSQGYGTHYATVWVGSPEPQRKSVIVDTGSHYTAFPCTGCAKCGEEHHTDAYFDPAKSQTFHALECGDCAQGARCSSTSEEKRCIFSQSYTEGSSWNAYQAVDRFFCGGNGALSASNAVDQSFAIDFMFGCQTRETGLFVTQLADGIMGMSAHPATLPKQMYDKGVLEHNMFTLCFRRELQVSKKGVHAGAMTLGGVDTRLHSSPMVYALDRSGTKSTGWYSVYVKHIFIRKSGGKSVTANEQMTDDIVKLSMDINRVNAGKGVIVDSGTTDTYLSKSLSGAFLKLWKEVTGFAYSNTAMKFTPEELLKLPTILIQLQAYDESPTAVSPDGVPGLVGKYLDPKSPNDVLLAIPATHYMEYSTTTDKYTPRLYFTESIGGVLGANAMQGHDVLFDWENGRVGFAESSCRYATAASPPTGIAPGNITDEGGLENDCRLGEPMISLSCVETVDMQLCASDPKQTLLGEEKWVMVVENPGTPQGLSCEELLEVADSTASPKPSRVECDGNGLCFQYLPCDITCENAEEIGAIVPVQDASKEDDGEGGSTGEPSSPSSSASPEKSCDDSLWSECEYSCNQTKVKFVLMSDGLCHEDTTATRQCHIGACGRADPCRVPFVVHSILVFPGGNAPLWDSHAEAAFAEAFAKTVNINRLKDGAELFGPGDVKVLMATHWYGDNSDVAQNDSKLLGMKIVVETSIFNPNALIPERRNETEKDDKDSGGEDNSTYHEGALQHVMGKANNFFHDVMVPMAKCSESDLYPLSKTALDVNFELGRIDFVAQLIENIRTESDGKNSFSDPFAHIYENPEFATSSKLLSTWTIKTEISKNPFTKYGINPDSALQYVENPTFMGVTLGFFMFVCCCGLCCGVICCRRSHYKKQADTIIEHVKERAADRRRGRYAKIGEEHGDDDDDSENGEFGLGNGVDVDFATSSEYCDAPEDSDVEDLELANSNYDEIKDRIKAEGGGNEKTRGVVANGK